MHGKGRKNPNKETNAKRHGFSLLTQSYIMTFCVFMLGSEYFTYKWLQKPSTGYRLEMYSYSKNFDF
jgi:hypothetical protein